MDFLINFDCFENHIKEYHPKDILLSVDKTIKTFNIKEHELCREHPNCSGAFEPFNIIDKTYVIYAVYSTGDPEFNYNDTQIEFIEVFLNEEKAIRCKKQIEANYSLFTYLSNTFTLNENLVLDLSKNVLNLPKDKNNLIDASKMHNVYYQNEKDEIKKFRSPWHGYFNSLDSIHLNSHSHTLTKKFKNF